MMGNKRRKFDWDIQDIQADLKVLMRTLPGRLCLDSPVWVKCALNPIKEFITLHVNPIYLSVSPTTVSSLKLGNRSEWSMLIY